MPDNLIEPDYALPFQAWRAAPTPHSAGNLLRAVDPILRSAVSSYGGSQASPTLASQARRLTLEGLQRYDPSQGKLKPFLMQHLQGLRRIHHRSQQIVNVPEQLLLDRQHIDQQHTELTEQLGRPPSTAELSDATGLSTRRLLKIRSYHPGLPEGMLYQQRGEQEGGFDPAVASDASAEQAWTNFVYAGLTPVDQLVLEHTLGLHGRPVLDNRQLAKTLGVSPSAVSQRKARIQEQLNSRQRLGVL